MTSEHHFNPFRSYGLARTHELLQLRMSEEKDFTREIHEWITRSMSTSIAIRAKCKDRLAFLRAQRVSIRKDIRHLREHIQYVNASTVMFDAEQAQGERRRNPFRHKTIVEAWARLRWLEAEEQYIARMVRGYGAGHWATARLRQQRAKFRGQIRQLREHVRALEAKANYYAHLDLPEAEKLLASKTEAHRTVCSALDSINVAVAARESVDGAGLFLNQLRTRQARLRKGRDDTIAEMTELAKHIETLRVEREQTQQLKGLWAAAKEHETQVATRAVQEKAQTMDDFCLKLYMAKGLKDPSVKAPAPRDGMTKDQAVRLEGARNNLRFRKECHEAATRIYGAGSPEEHKWQKQVKRAVAARKRVQDEIRNSTPDYWVEEKGTIPPGFFQPRSVVFPCAHVSFEQFILWNER